MILILFPEYFAKSFKRAPPGFNNYPLSVIYSFQCFLDIVLTTYQCPIRVHYAVPELIETPETIFYFICTIEPEFVPKLLTTFQQPNHISKV